MIELYLKKFYHKASLKRFMNVFLSSRIETKIYQDCDEFLFLISFVKRHPEAHIKLSGQIEYFHIRKGFAGQTELYINKGTHEIVVSWNKCCTGIKENDKSRLISAMREAISSDIILFKNQSDYIGKNCELCGDIISDDNVHVDHEITFKSISDEFLSKNTPWPEKFYKNNSTNIDSFCLEDSAFENKWKEFHSEKSKLRIVHSRCNLLRKS